MEEIKPKVEQGMSNGMKKILQALFLISTPFNAAVLYNLFFDTENNKIYKLIIEFYDLPIFLITGLALLIIISKFTNAKLLQVLPFIGVLIYTLQVYFFGFGWTEESRYMGLLIMCLPTLIVLGITTFVIFIFESEREDLAVTSKDITITFILSVVPLIMLYYAIF